MPRTNSTNKAKGAMTMNDESSSIDESRLFIPALAGVYRALGPMAYAFVRVVMGLVLVPSGYDKVFQGGVNRIAAGNVAKLGLDNPLAWAWAVGGLEFFGAILLALGLFTRPIAFAMTVMMAVITFGVQFNAGFFWSSRGYEVALVWTAVLLAFALSGGGRYSLDHKLGREF